MSWINFKKNHLFSVNVAIVASLILWQVRKDFQFHPVILAWLVAGFFIPSVRVWEKKILHFIGRINGTIILALFYFLFFTPFSFIYRWKYRHPSFEKLQSTFVVKDEISDFERPF